MKKYILFFISLCVIVTIFFVYSTINVQESKEVTFIESGYILNGSQSRYYFKEDEIYTKTFDDKISFIDTDGKKVLVDRENFIHYESGNIITLQDGVLLDLSKITEDPITYYNVSSGKEIKKLSNRYVVKNLDKDMPFDQGIFKISANKYIILGKNIKVTLNNGTTRDINDYIEIEYYDNEIVSIYNQEINYQTISSDSYIELDGEIKINLGTKIISNSDENKMSLDNMVINSDDNINLADINEKKSLFKNKENEKNEVETENKVDEKVINNNSQSIVNNNNQEIKQETIVNNGVENSNIGNNIETNTIENKINENTNAIGNETSRNTNTIGNETSQNTNTINNETIQNTNTIGNEISENTNSIAENENKIVLEPSIIEVNLPDDDESEVNSAIYIAEPTATFENMKITAVGVNGEIQIKDENDLLSKEDNIVVKIINSATGKVVYQVSEDYGVYNIPIAIETLRPNCKYTIVVFAKYILDEKVYTKNILYKNFVTLPVGLEIAKNYCTDSSINYNINITDSDIESVIVSILDSEGNILPNRDQVVRNIGNIQTIGFDELESNTKYTLRISEITYLGVVQTGENWIIDIDVQTLKQKCSINKLNYQIDRREGTFKLTIDDVTDKDNAIESYRYVIYQFTENEDEEGNTTLVYDENNSIYERETTNKEIKITVGSENSDNKIKRNNYYGFKVVATYFDNEKDVEVESRDICGAFSLGKIEFPYVKFEREDSENPATEIEGWLYIIDNDNAVVIDGNNPLTITYSSDVDEAKVYKKITSLESVEKTKDFEGNDVIKIKIDFGGKGSEISGLKSDEKYNISVYGTVDLGETKNEGEANNSNLYKNVFIGSAIVSTKDYSELIANFNKISDSQSTFALEFNLEGDEINRNAISSIDIMLYEGSGDVNEGEYRNWNRTITRKNYTSVLSNVKEEDAEINSLDELLFDNTLIITPSFIGGGKEKNYKELKYQVLVTATIDGTEYPNKIPIVVDESEDENKGNIIYTNKDTNENYTAAYIIVDGGGTTEKVTETLQKPKSNYILNKDAERNGLEKREFLDENTIVGFKIGTDFSNTGSLVTQEITYYAWDKNGIAVLDKEGRQIVKKIKITNQSKMPDAIFEIEDSINELSGLHRGKGYYFTYTVEYKDNNGEPLIWPICESTEKIQYTNQSLNTATLYPQKQRPTFMIYPKTSGDNFITYVYSCYDYDKALNYFQDTAYLNVLANGVNINENIVVIPDKTIREFTISNLHPKNNYTICYLKNLNADLSDIYESEDLTTQWFEGTYNCDSVNIQNIETNSESSPNMIKITLSGENLERIAAGKVILKKGNQSIETDLLKIEKTNGNYYLTVDILELSKKYNTNTFNSFLQTNIGLEVVVYYDSGKIGYEIDDDNDYVTYINTDGSYLKLNKYNNFEDSNTIIGNLYSYTMAKGNDAVTLNISNIDDINTGSQGNDVIFMYSANGLKQNDIIVVQKQILEKNINNHNAVFINNLIIGINVKEINVSLGKADFKTEINNIMNINVDNMYVEIWGSKYRNEEPNWNSANNKTIPFEDFQEFSLTGLNPAEFYYVRFKYLSGADYVYTYDTETKEIGRVYEFETMATININNIEITYNIENYRTKFLGIKYTIDELKSNQYEKTKYNIYQKDTMEKVNINEAIVIQNGNYKEYNIIDGSLIVNNLAYSTDDKFSNVNEILNVSPQNNIFSMGQEYILEIIPIILTENNEEIEIEKETTEFMLEIPKSPTFALFMKRNSNTGEGESKYIMSYVSIKDYDGRIYGSQDYGEYEMHIYKYKDSIDEKVEVDFYKNGQNLRGTTFNLLEHGSRFMVYVRGDDVDYSYNYITEITMRYDDTNKGNEETLREITKKFSIKGISNDVSIGSSNVELVGKNFELRFYDSYYNIDKVNSITYSIYDLDNTISQMETFVPTWREVHESEDITYFKTTCPYEITDKGIYIIKMNLYSDGVLVGQIDNTYIYE